ncbi:MAG: chemotaxis response regulator protein-glutamate methylesterase [Desulfobulbaceae bacterium]|nr:chemotaxis response regulator protein-glutamate methylesterase [Desulfobulbaceae bacterium]
MSPQTKIRILIVDDSRIFRTAVQEALAGEKDFEIVGSVWNGIKAMECIRSTPPHVVTLDIQMPEMDGLETLEAIQKINADLPPDRRIGVIMLSSHTRRGADITVKALEMGAFDFIPKPESASLRANLDLLGRQLAVKIRNYAAVSLPASRLRRPVTTGPATPVRTGRDTAFREIEAVMIGVSTGGPKALAEILPPLCAGIDVPVFIVQHMPPTFTQSLAKSLNAKCRYEITEGADGDIAARRRVYIAPGGRHMVLERKEGKARIVINDLPPEKGCRPSIDLLFRSGAEVFGRSVIGVILTGMGSDGTEGARELKREGALIIAQDEETSVVWGMPGSAKAAGAVDDILPLHDIPGTIVSLVQHKAPFR